MKSLNLLFLAFVVSFGMQAQELVVGKATLLKSRDGVYSIKKEDGPVKKIDIRPNVDKHLQGTLAVLFKDCKETRQAVFNLKEINEADLIKTVEQYNNCSYTSFEPTQKEIMQSTNFQGDEYRFFTSIGASLNRISYFNRDSYENLAQVELGLGVSATPGFMGGLQGNIYFTFEINAAFSGDKNFGNTDLSTNFKKNSYKGSLGAEYHFNKNGSFQPLLGIGAGLVRDHYNGSYDNYKVKQTIGSGFWFPKVGVLFSLADQKSLGIMVSYIPEYENDLSFIADGEKIPWIIKTHFINAGLYLYF